jgi:hypothetical protein
MFRKLNPAAWEMQDVAAMSAFLFTLGVFLFFTLRALRMKRSHSEHMSRLPLEPAETDSRHE